MSVCRMGKVPMCVEERRQSIPLDVDDKQKTLPMCVEPIRRGGRGLPAISGIVDTPGDLPDAAEHWLENWLVKDATDIYGTEMALFSARAVSGDQKAWEYIGSIKGDQGLPAISGVVKFGFDLPTPASNYDGQNWLVQDDFTRLMVLYRSENGEWVDIGSIRGANGTPGTNGENGVTFYPNVNEYGVISWTNDGEKENPQPRNIAGKDGSGIQIFGTYNELPNAFNHPEISSAIVCRGAPEPYYLYENTGFGWFGRGSLKGDRGDMPFWFGTRAEYNALQTLDPDVCYCIEEGT